MRWCVLQGASNTCLFFVECSFKNFCFHDPIREKVETNFSKRLILGTVKTSYTPPFFISKTKKMCLPYDFTFIFHPFHDCLDQIWCLVFPPYTIHAIILGLFPILSREGRWTLTLPACRRWFLLCRVWSSTFEILLPGAHYLQIELD